MKKDFSKLEKKINVTFENKKLLAQALVHRSYLNEHPSFELNHNERLEFLGDAVLELIVTEYLYNNYDNPEGDLTNWRASLVNSKMLAKLAKDTDLDDFLYLSRGESKDTGKARQYILANAFEAVIGSIYLDQGWDAAKNFICEHLLPELPYILKHKLYMDPKSKLQESSQEKEGVTPTYKVLEESGPDHAKKFVIGVFLGKTLVAKGGGSSKQEAQEDAATKAIKKKKWN
ncbi:MAG TPA: ribonuclease III [Candidatus Bipolaricaulota bacterium]|nr:ribonuclease III [Candidatus Bipolaricaulota bacterium]